MTYRIVTSKNPEEFANEITQKLAEGFQFMGPIIIHEGQDLLWVGEKQVLTPTVTFIREMMRDSSVKPATAPQIRSIKQ